MHEASVVLGLEDPALQEEVLHFLDRLPGVQVVGATVDGIGLAREVRRARPDAAVVSPGVLRGAPDLDGASVFVVAPKETMEALRTALRGGARGFYLWPDERDALARHAERAARPRGTERGAAGRVVAVYGPRGGVGATFLATNLAAACAAQAAETVVVDLDTFYGDVAVALGIVPDQGTATLADLIPVIDELSPEHLDRVLVPHARGFRVLLAPPEPEPVPELHPSAVSALLRQLRGMFDAVIIHLPRAIDGRVRAALEEADDVLMVITLDVVALRDARRAISFLGSAGVRDNCRLIVNRASRGEVVIEDAERVLGLRPVSVIRVDRQVPRTQNRGQLLAARSGPAARRIAALARRLLEEGRR